ncbi:hypothetical protein LguiA_036037 [Lonicera macranthoides]
MLVRIETYLNNVSFPPLLSSMFWVKRLNPMEKFASWRAGIRLNQPIGLVLAVLESRSESNLSHLI